MNFRNVIVLGVSGIITLSGLVGCAGTYGLGDLYNGAKSLVEDKKRTEASSMAQGSESPESKIVAQTDGMYWGPLYGNVYFKDAVKAFEERTKTVEKRNGTKVSDPAYVTLSNEIGTLSDKIVALEKAGWTKKREEIRTEIAAAKTQRDKVTGDKTHLNAGIAKLEEEEKFASERISDLELVPGAYAGEQFDVRKIAEQQRSGAPK